MSTVQRSLFMTASLAFMCVLSGTLLIPAVRPFMAWTAPGSESAAHAFMAVNMLGGVLAAPLVTELARYVGSPSRLIRTMSAADAVLLALLVTGVPVGTMLAIRGLQGALNVSVLSLLLGSAPSGEETGRGSRYGLLGAAMMLAVAAGAPLGTLCLALGPRAPLLACAALQLVVAASVGKLSLERVPPATAAGSSRAEARVYSISELRSPIATAWVRSRASRRESTALV